MTGAIIDGMKARTIRLATPAGAQANNGNWHTAARWARMLSDDYRVRVTGVDPAPEADRDAALLIALHARKSAPAIAAWPAERPVLLVLTGTDLYRDLPAGDPSTRASLARADGIVVLHERAPLDLPAELRGRVGVVVQSATALPPADKPERGLKAIAVGHLRDEKGPQVLFDAVRRLQPDEGIEIEQAGEALDPRLGEQARALARARPDYRWLGPLPHDAVRERMRRAHLLVHPSRMEGGAHAIIEAVRGGTPVLVSRISGNMGLMGDDYAGVFDDGDADGLAALLRRARDDPGFRARLAEQCARRAPLFEPERERAALLAAVARVLER